MSISAAPSPLPPAPAAAPAGPRSRRLDLTRVPRPRPELLVLLALAGVLDLWALGQNGWANTYYSAAVRSMTTSWHNFLFASFDASGVMTVDKPPLALWVQAGSARIFGFSSWSLLVPQALMGIASVALVYDLVARRFGRAAGFAGGLALAVTPITVAMSRHNNPDALLVLCSTAALWFLVRGLEDGRTRWVVLAGVMVGLGFEAKMAAALPIVPAMAAAYLYVAPGGSRDGGPGVRGALAGRLRAVRQLVWGGAAMAAVGLAWPVLVWLTPAGSRPWVSGTSDNSIWSLIFGYNGLGRVDGQAGGPAGAAGGPGGRGGGGGLFGGSTGPLRLLNDALGGQAGWLLGVAVAGGILLTAATRLRRADPRTGWLIAVGGAFATTVVVFSTAKGIFHPYYVSALAPLAAALVGATVALVAGGGRLARVGGPLAVAGGVATELMVLHEHPESLGWLAPVLGVAAVAAAVALAVLGAGRVRPAVLAGIAGVLLIAPASWSAQTLGHATSSTFPAGGPVSAQGMGGPGGFRGARGALPPRGFAGPGGAAGGPPARPSGGPGGPGAAGGGPGGGMFGGNGNLTQAVAYAKAHGGGTVAVSSQQGASDAIIRTGADVAAIGGFSGRESEVSVQWLAQAVRSGRIRWVLTDGSGGMAGPADTRVGAGAVMAAVQQVGTAVDLTQTGSGATTASSTTTGGLYDLQGKADALQALAG